MTDKTYADLNLVTTLGDTDLFAVWQGSPLTVMTRANFALQLFATTALGITLGGTGATTASGARSNLGLGDMALQAASSVAVTGGTISGATGPAYTGVANTFTAQQIASLTSNGATIYPLGLRNAGTGASTGVGLDMDPGGNGVGVRVAQLIAVNNGSNVITLNLRTSNAGAPNTRVAVNGDGTLRFLAYGAGTLVTDASGNVTASSDARLKDVAGPFARGLDDLKRMGAPVVYSWKVETTRIAEARAALPRLRSEAQAAEQMLAAGGDEDAQHAMNDAADALADAERLAALDEPAYVGWLAQDAREGVPEAVSEGPDGLLQFSDRPVLATLYNAVLELSDKLAALQDEVARLQGPA